MRSIALFYTSLCVSLCALSVSMLACDSGSSSGLGEVRTFSGSIGSTGVAQPGAQDFGRFRAIIESGQLPTVETFDSVGFFNEHKFDLPPADCGEPVCLHALLGVGGNLMNGNNTARSCSSD